MTNNETLDPDMPADQLRLHMGELTASELLVARAAIRWANSRSLSESVLDRVVEALEDCLDWMERLRKSGDSGQWDWSVAGEYINGKNILSEIQALRGK